MSATLLSIATLILAITLSACTSFDPDKLRAHIRTKLPAQDTAPRVIAGEVVHTIQTTQEWEEVYVAYYDSAATLQIVTGDIDRVETKDTQLVLSDVADAPPPRTLSVAMRAVGGVYRPTEYPEMRKTDPMKTTLWILFGLPTFLISSMLIFAFIGDSINPKRPPGWFSISYGAETGMLIGMLVGLFSWILLTI